MTMETPRGIWPRRTHSWGWAILLGLIILACGAVMGSAITYRIMANHRWDMPGPPDRMPEQIVAHLRHELGLNDEQTNAISEIFSKSYQKMESLRVKVQPEFEAEMDAVHAAVAAVLNPEQKKLWNERIQRMREHFPPKSMPPPPPINANGP